MLAEKDQEIILLTCKKSWKVVLEIRGSWSENKGKNEPTVLEFFSADRPHGIHAFWSRKGPRNHPLDLEKSWKVALKIQGAWPENKGENEATVFEKFSADRPHGIHAFWSRKGPRNHSLDLEKFLESGPQNSGVLATE